MSEPVPSGAAGPSGLSNPPARSTTFEANTSKPTVTIAILGRELRIRSDEPRAHLEALARYVDDRIVQIAGPKKAEAADPSLLLITALQLADEIFKLKSQQAELATRLRASTRSLLGRLDTSPHSSPDHGPNAHPDQAVKAPQSQDPRPQPRRQAAAPKA